MSTPPPVDTDTLAEICRLTRRITDLEQQIAKARTPRNFADNDIDRTALEGP